MKPARGDLRKSAATIAPLRWLWSASKHPARIGEIGLRQVHTQVSLDDRFALVRLAPLRLALVSVEPYRFALVRFWPLKSQPVRSLSSSPMPCKFFAW